jgi:TonB family protein
VSGAERTTFYSVVEATAKQFGLTIQPDAHPEAGHYYRSDHFSLARVGIPSFSISQGVKFKGHDLAWGEAQAQDYVKNHYHQPSDEYHADWDFRGLAEMASFGYELGRAAASQPQPIGWLAGDEFEKAGKKLEPGKFDGDALFADRPDLKLLHAEAVVYPPLARQTRIVGTVVLRVSVASDGTVSHVEVLKGHPLLSGAIQENVQQWKFAAQPGEPRTFELRCEFGLREAASTSGRQIVTVPESLHLLILATPAIIYTNYAK